MLTDYFEIEIYMPQMFARGDNFAQASARTYALSELISISPVEFSQLLWMRALHRVLVHKDLILMGALFEGLHWYIR